MITRVRLNWLKASADMCNTDEYEMVFSVLSSFKDRKIGKGRDILDIHACVHTLHT